MIADGRKIYFYVIYVKTRIDYIQALSKIRNRDMKIGFLIYPNVTALDFTGPAQVFSQLAQCDIYFIGKNNDAVQTDAGFSLNPTTSIQECPQMDLLCIPGGLGQKVVADDPQFMDFIQQQAKEAKYLTSVCSGSLILAKAGLLKGYRATSHWAALDQLNQFGAIAVDQRVVIDGNRISGGGVTAGIDFGLTLVAKLFGEKVAKHIQLGLEYDPAPPFDCGSPKKAPKELTEKIRQRFSQVEII